MKESFNLLNDSFTKIQDEQRKIMYKEFGFHLI